MHATFSEDTLREEPLERQRYR